MNESEDKIVKGLRRGCPEAWSSLYDLYAERVWRAAARLLGGDSHETADIVQEVFMAAAESASRFDPKRGSLWNWLSGIVRNKVSLRFRRHASRISSARRWWNGMNEASKQWLSGGGDAPDGALEAWETAMLVRDALLEISDEHRALLVGKYIEDQSAEQLAVQYGGTAGAIRARLLRARQAFRKVFSAKVDQPELTRSKS
ncbi:MAG: sigma-70 family RNA polymerase sigma factor [Phycisphaerae bacterium]|jgi:RNA polymerase sigma-70 factor (ECF subfamily)|nr:sigma-70 family RNA polymerase sigma factor [Phycisphaerae bacterium]